MSEDWFTFKAYADSIKALSSVLEDKGFHTDKKKNACPVSDKEMQQADYFFNQMEALNQLDKYKILPIYFISFYYAFYFCLRACLILKGIKPEHLKSHAALINTANNINFNEPDFFSYPFNIVYEGKAMGFRNLPTEFENNPKDFQKKVRFPEFVEASKHLPEGDQLLEFTRLYLLKNMIFKKLRQKDFSENNLAHALELDRILTFLRTTSEKNKHKKETRKITMSCSLFDAMYRYRKRLNYENLAAFSFTSSSSLKKKKMCDQICQHLFHVATTFRKGI